MSVLVQGLLRYTSPDTLERLARVRMLIIGAGGLGSNVAFMLARSGIRRFILVDRDRVEASNLNRQAYFPADLGRPKVEALAEHLRALDPKLELDCRVAEIHARNAHDFFTLADAVVEAVDGAATKAMLCEAAAAARMLYVTASGLTGLGGPDAVMTERRLGPRMYCVGDPAVLPGDSSPPLAPRVMQAAAMQANIILRELM